MVKSQRLLKSNGDNGGPERVVTPVWRCGCVGRTWQSGGRGGDGRMWRGQLEAPKTWAYRACLI
ncbi:hypothetical protein V6Z11_A07G158700 [Gossypium hirsutum]